MPLTRFVNDWTSRLGALLVDEAVAVIDISVPAENEEMASRIVVNWASQRGGSAAFVGIDVSSEDALCRSVAMGLASICAAVRQAADAGPPVAPPPDAATPGAPTVESSIHRVERVASWASPFVHTIVLAARCSSGPVPSWLRAAVASTSSSVKWLVLHDERTSLGLDDEVTRRGATSMSMMCLTDARRQLAELCERRDGPRVLTCDGPVEELLPFIERECLAGLVGWRVVRATHATVHPRTLALAGIEALGALDRTAGDPIRELARVLEAAARERPTLLVLCPSAPPGAAPCVDLAELGARLAAHVLEADARVLIVGRGVSRKALARVAVHPFRIDARCIEDGIARRLAEGCPRPDASRFEAALASFAAARGEDERALAHAERAVRLALEEMDALPLLVRALMTLGSVLSHAERLPEALEAFTRCAELAAACDEGVVVGRALASIGHLYARIESFDFAIRCYRVGAAVSRSVGDEGGTAHAETWLAEALRRTGDVVEAATTLGRVAESVPRSTLPALDALFSAARGEASARLAGILRDAGLHEHAAAADRAAAGAGHRGHLGSCPYP